MKRSRTLPMLMLLGLILGGVFGIVIHDDLSSGTTVFHHSITWLQSALGIEPVAKSGQFAYGWLRETGTFILIRPLMLLALPLMFVSVVLGVTSMRDPTRLGLIGGATLVLFLTSIVAAATLGAVMSAGTKPGQWALASRQPLTARAEAELKSSPDYHAVHARQSAGRDTIGSAWKDMLDQVVPQNIVREMAEGRSLGVLLFAVLLGLALAMGGERGLAAVRVFESVNDALLRLVGWLMWTAPAGIALLVAWAIGRVGLEALTGPLSRYMLLMISAMAIHALVVLPAMLLILGRTNPLRFLWQCRRAVLAALGTASPLASVPVTLDDAVHRAGCSRRAANFVIPLGSTINVGGTALYATVTLLFLCQLYGIDLVLNEQIIVVTAAVLASMATAGLPAAGLIAMVIVIASVNTMLVSTPRPTLPAGALGVVIAVDCVLDMCRIALNVWGDMVAARIITRIAPDEPHNT